MQTLRGGFVICMEGGLYFFAPLYEIALEFFGKRHARVQRGLGKLTSGRHARGSPGQSRAQTETEHQRQENRHGNEGDQQFYLVELQFLRRHCFLRFSRACGRPTMPQADEV